MRVTGEAGLWMTTFVSARPVKRGFMPRISRREFLATRKSETEHQLQITDPVLL